MVNEDVRHIVCAELNSDEKLLWADKPHKLILSFKAVYTTGFFLIWTIMAMSMFGAGIFATIIGVTNGNTAGEATGMAAVGVIFTIFSILFVMVGIVMVFLGFKMLIGPNREVYALTSKRGIIISPFLKYRVASLSPENLKNSERKGKPDFGTLTFSNNANGMMAIWMNRYQTQLSAFRKIKNPKQVQNLIYRTFEELPHE